MAILNVGDLERALILLPMPLFRHGDIYDVAVELGFDRSLGEAFWNGLTKRGWIVKTGTMIPTRKNCFYWERMPNRIPS